MGIPVEAVSHVFSAKLVPIISASYTSKALMEFSATGRDVDCVLKSFQKDPPE